MLLIVLPHMADFFVLSLKVIRDYMAEDFITDLLLIICIDIVRTVEKRIVEIE